MIQRCIMTFFRWWVGQLSGLIPARLLHVYYESGDATVLEIAGDRFVLFVRRAGVLSRAADGGLRKLADTMKSRADLPKLRLLRLPAGQALHKRLSLPYAVRRDLQSVLGFEIDRETPFEQNEVYWSHAIAGHDAARTRLDIDLVVVPRTVADLFVMAAQRAGYDPAALEVENGSGPAARLWLDGAERGQGFSLQPGLVPWARAAAALAVAVIVMPFVAQQWHLFFADRAIAAYQVQAREASALNQAANRRAAAIQFMGQTQGAGGSALAVLLAATRALPDDTYLTSLSLHDGQISMTGSSEAAAGVIGALAKSVAFRDPAFDSPVVEGDGAGERFTISVKLAPAGSP